MYIPQGHMAESETDTHPSDGVPSAPGAAPWAELDVRGKAWRVAAIAFAVLHLGAMLVGGAVEPIKKVFRPIVGFYSDGLRMANAWGMFGKPPTTTHVVVEAALGDGRIVELSTTEHRGRSFVDRVRDARIRKLEGRIGEDADKGRFGWPFLDYYCRVALRAGLDAREVRLRNEVHPLLDDDGKPTRAASTSILLLRRCGAGAERPRLIPPPSRPVAPGPVQGDM